MGRPANDWTDKTVGKLTVLRRTGTTPRGRAVWECRCECGKVCDLDAGKVKAGLGCPACASAGGREKLRRDYLGRVQGTRLTVTAMERGRRVTWLVCDCDCGTKGFRATVGNVAFGRTSSCGCLHRETARRNVVTARAAPKRGQPRCETCRRPVPPNRVRYCSPDCRTIRNAKHRNKSTGLGLAAKAASLGERLRHGGPDDRPETD
jgi:hypothetical protein